ncbi:undecaprenyl diphosphate synthase [Ruminococcus sp. YE71]|uniref:isoprenyl transferase n=1 Tax=unclassified Ruminococcus TaxID=2608920 RepID=UPI00088A8519|nr:MULTISPECIES: isoprenyl transferase [unclassified Ruminococcus]SDA20900.1 undecaprenyl diphosphate synthase [Ruminococcus sp. YE78]SFW33399.1 undecaprenyl diphosphate synthase [Ruminococcus sp. YE71]
MAFKDNKPLLPEGTNVPVHIGVIMDGNGRWAKKRGLPRKLGHREGAQTFRTITRHAKKLGVKYFTVYAFSTENWRRPADEVEALMDLFEKYLDEVRDFIEENIRICFIGDRSMLRPVLQQKMKSVEEDSRDFSAMTLLIAINYGGRDEIVHAARRLAEDVRAGKISPEDIDEQAINNRLYTAEMDGDIAPDVDLIIRPSGEQRLSNFMIWQAAYAEYYFTNILWPDFKPADLEKAVIAYSDRNRRFGSV